jgi:hypothetical protein
MQASALAASGVFGMRLLRRQAGNRDKGQEEERKEAVILGPKFHRYFARAEFTLGGEFCSDSSA